VLKPNSTSPITVNLPLEETRTTILCWFGKLPLLQTGILPLLIITPIVNAILAHLHRRWAHIRSSRSGSMRDVSLEEKEKERKGKGRKGRSR
jgi:hypothetical protein